MAIFVDPPPGTVPAPPPYVQPATETLPGMPVRAWLSDDVDVTLRYLDRPERAGVTVALDGDDYLPWPGIEAAPTEFPAATNPPNQWVFTIKTRQRTGYTDDGDPIFAWGDLVTAASLLYEERRETDAIAGVTVVTAKVTVPYSGIEDVPESSVAIRSDGKRYAVTRSLRGPDRIELWLRRTEQDT